MSRHCPNCGYPISGRPDYDDSIAEGGELPVYDSGDSVLGVLGDPNLDVEPRRRWWQW